jgi:hypothetical protein
VFETTVDEELVAPVEADVAVGATVVVVAVVDSKAAGLVVAVVESDAAAVPTDIQKKIYHHFCENVYYIVQKK